MGSKDGYKRASKIDPPKAGESRTDQDNRAQLISFDAFSPNSFANVEMGGPGGFGNALAQAAPVTVTSDPHTAEVSLNKLQISLLPGTRAGGNTLEGQPLAEFQIFQRTEARTREPPEEKFANSNAISRGQVSGITLTNRFPVGGVPFGFNPRIELVWQLNRMSLRADPKFARAFMRHEVLVNDVPFGFKLDMIDGKLTSSYSGDAAAKAAFDTWFQVNARQRDNRYALNPGAGALSVNAPLGGELLKGRGQLSVKLENRNYEFSFELPPLANGKAKEGAGHEPPQPGPGGVNPTPNMHWNAATETLTFDDVPVNTLVRDHGEGIDPRYAGDPMLGAFLHVDPLVFAFDVDGQRYFAGGHVTIGDGVTQFFSARLPALVLDESLYESQGINMFAPLTDILINLDMGSLWAQDYFDRMLFDGALAPEFFVSLANRLMLPGGADPFADSFDLFAGVDVSFSTTVAEPNSIALLAGAVVAFGLARRRAREQCPTPMMGLAIRTGDATYS